FGPGASTRVAGLLRERGIAVHLGRRPLSYADGWLELDEELSLPADRVVALPRLEGPRIAGVPHDAQGFVKVDRCGRVEELEDVYAAGDITTFPVKQGGIASQQADLVARSIAERAGAAIEDERADVVAFAVLLTGGEPIYLQADLAPGHEQATTLASDPLFWPPSKVAARRLAPFLASMSSSYGAEFRGSAESVEIAPT